MAESRIRRGKTKGFFTLYRDSAQDDRLSLEARGLFALMMSLPENWEYSVSGLAVKAGCGKDRIRRILGELQDVGYLIREQSHDSGGKFSGNIYVLQDEAPPLSGKPDNGGLGEMPPLSGNTVNGENRQRETPSSVFPTQKNIDLKEEEIKRPPKAPQGGRRAAKKKDKSMPQYQPEWFERFWKKYPPREGRKDHRPEAVAAWDKLKPSLELCLKMSEELEPKNWPESWHRDKGRYIPLASTWLNGERWNVERIAPEEQREAPKEQPKVRRFHVEVIDGEEVNVYDE